MEYVRDAKLSTLELVRNLIFRGKKVLGDEGLTIDAIRSTNIVADTVCARKFVSEETPCFSDTSMRWLKRGQGDLCTTIGLGSFAASGEHVRVLGNRSCAIHAVHTDIEGFGNVVVGGSENYVSGNENMIIGAHQANVLGSRCMFLGGTEPIQCLSDNTVLVRTPNVPIANVNHQEDRILLLATNGVCTSVNSVVVGKVHDVSVRAGTTIPENTIHWSIESSNDSNTPGFSLIASYKDGYGHVYEGQLPLRLVDDS